MLLPTILIVAVNLALGFLAAVGREKLLALRAVTAIMRFRFSLLI